MTVTVAKDISTTTSRRVDSQEANFSIRVLLFHYTINPRSRPLKKVDRASDNSLITAANITPLLKAFPHYALDLLFFPVAMFLNDYHPSTHARPATIWIILISFLFYCPTWDIILDSRHLMRPNVMFPRPPRAPCLSNLICSRRNGSFYHCKLSEGSFQLFATISLVLWPRVSDALLLKEDVMD